LGQAIRPTLGLLDSGEEAAKLNQALLDAKSSDAVAATCYVRLDYTSEVFSRETFGVGRLVKLAPGVKDTQAEKLILAEVAQVIRGLLEQIEMQKTSAEHMSYCRDVAGADAIMTKQRQALDRTATLLQELAARIK
jgi:hypothetical protein